MANERPDSDVPAGPYAEVHVTCGNRDEAERIAGALVERRLAACVQMAPTDSVYVWDGAVHRDPEVGLHVKTRSDRFPAIVEVIEELHSYELPAITMVPMTGSELTLAWIDDLVG
jgi:periplasmic divalent cation tolerance protein